MSKKIVVAALSAVLAAGLSTHAMAEDTKMDMKHFKTPKGMEKCYGITKAGKNDCGSNDCAGSSKKDSDKSAFIVLPKGTCDKIVGGSTSAE